MRNRHAETPPLLEPALYPHVLAETSPSILRFPADSDDGDDRDGAAASVSPPSQCSEDMPASESTQDASELDDDPKERASAVMPGAKNLPRPMPKDEAQLGRTFSTWWRPTIRSATTGTLSRRPPTTYWFYN